MCVFAPHNLLQDPPFSRLDLISCRNVMICHSAESQEALLPRFHYALNPGGFLWLGPSETTGKGDRFFESLDRQARIFRRDDRAPPGYSTVDQPPPHKRTSAKVTRAPPMPAADRRPADDIAVMSEEAFLRRLAPAFATINRRNEVIYVSDAMPAFIRSSCGATSTALDAFLAPALRLPVHSALDEGREKGAPAEIRNVVISFDKSLRMFDVRVSPVSEDSDLMLLAFTEARTAQESELGEADASRQRRGREQELTLTRKRLGTLEREYEGAEQEMRSAKEELLSVNEELESSNEELDTSRGELQSINAELSVNNRQFIRANSDLKNLLESTNIATLFIDQYDCVRAVHPREVGKLFGVQKRDIGRSIHDLARHVAYPDLKSEAAEVGRTLQSIEREVRIDAPRRD